MSRSKLHTKLSKNKEATVSLDSLLGLLSSAYGTEELDSKTVFCENTVNWQSLSVENFTLKKSTEVSDVEKPKIKAITHEFDKLSVTTSTTSLRKAQESNREIDITLLSIKSLETFKPVGKCKIKTIKSEEVCESMMKKDAENVCSVSNPEENNEGVKLENESNNLLSDNQPMTVICGFFVDDSHRKLMFDIKFFKKPPHNATMPSFDLDDSEISINLIDTSKDARAGVKIGKECLISKSKYFSKVENEYGLANLDVVVECNLNVFQWVLQWTKADIVMCKPALNVSNLKPILCVAYHLDIDLLIQECLEFLHENCKAVLESEWDIEEVLNDQMFYRLAKLFSHSEINGINEYFESFKSRLYCALITILGEQEPLRKVGHYFSLATIFQCEFCDKVLHRDQVDSVLCVGDHNQFDHFGNLIPFHKPLPAWDLTRYIQLTHEKLKCWKLVYWKLWGLCHFLYCVNCQSLFPLEQHDWCRYHPEEMEFFPLNAEISHPIGTYKCCSQVGFRFNAWRFSEGCSYKSHKPSLETENFFDILKVYETYKHFIRSQPLEMPVTKKFVKLVKDVSEDKASNFISNNWWQGGLLACKEKKDYSMIPTEVLNILRNKPKAQKPPTTLKPLEIKESTHFCSIHPSSSVSDELKLSDSNASCANGAKLKKAKQKLKKIKSIPTFPSRNKFKRKKSCLYQPAECVWNSSESMKDNQDNQRDFEEIAMRSLVKMLTPEATSGFSCEPTAGTYIRLESDWWQENVRESKSFSAKSSGTVVNRTFPLSWFRRLTI